MTEPVITTHLLKTLRSTLSDYIFFKHADIYSHGMPDISATGDGLTSWWEIKHANPGFSTKGIQYETCRRLANAGICHYIIFAEEPTRTIIIPPHNLEHWKTWGIVVPTFNYAWVAAFILAAHQDVR